MKYTSCSMICALLFLGTCHVSHANDMTTNVVFCIPFDGDPYARTPEVEVEANGGKAVLADILYVDGIEGRAARLGKQWTGKTQDVLVNAVTYPLEWLKTSDQGTIALWYKNPVWVEYPWRIPAMATPGFYEWAKTSDWDTPVSRWIHDRLVAPPEQGKSKWHHYEIGNKTNYMENTRTLIPREHDDNTWHFWALRWNRDKGVIEVIDDDSVRDISTYESLLKPGKEYWEETYMGRTTRVYEDVKHINFDDVFLTELQIARYCTVTLDDVVVFDKALPRSELEAAFKRGRQGKTIWPGVTFPSPRRRITNAVSDLSDMEALPEPSKKLKPATAGFDKTSKTRSVASLAGTWRFQPTPDRWTAPETGQWGYVELPWKGEGLRNTEAKALSPDTGSWDGSPLASLHKIWAYHEVEIPASLKTHRIFLVYDHYLNDNGFPVSMEFFVNGKRVLPSTPLGPGEVELTGLLKTGINNIVVATEAGLQALPWVFSVEAQEPGVKVAARHPRITPYDFIRDNIVSFFAHNYSGNKQTIVYTAIFRDKKTGEVLCSLHDMPFDIEPGETRNYVLRQAFDDNCSWHATPNGNWTLQLQGECAGKVVDETTVFNAGSFHLPESRMLVNKGEQLMICGDSITSVNRWAVFFDLYFSACRPDLDVTCVQNAIWGETGERFLNRMMPSCIEPFKPTLAVYFYGHNDINIASDMIMAGEMFRETLLRVIDVFEENDCRFVPGTMSIFAPGVKTWGKKVDYASRIARSVAIERNLPLAEVHQSLLLALQRMKKRHGQDYDIVRGDGVHAKSHGQMAIAIAFLRALGLDSDLARIEFDMNSGTATASEGHRITATTPDSITVESTRLPFFFPANPPNSPMVQAREVAETLRFFDDLDRFMLVVRTKEPGQYQVQWGGETKTFSDKQLAKGINLAQEFCPTPLDAHVQKISSAIRTKFAVQTFIRDSATHHPILVAKQKKWVQTQLEKDSDITSSKVIEDIPALREWAENRVRALQIPIAHTITISKQ